MFTKLVRLGRDAEVRFTAGANPTAVAGLAMVYDIGYGDKKRSQWIDGVLWGKRAESLAQYLTKGTQIVVTMDEVELEQFMKKDGTPGAKLKCKVVDLSLVSGQQQGGQQQAPQQRAPQQQAQQQYQQPGIDAHGNLDDIPF